MYYRVIVDDIGIYEAVQRDCPKEDSRRKNKPDGSWLNKIGEKYPGAVSFWTEKGFEKYNSSGLFEWHKSVVNGRIKIIQKEEVSNVLYKDEYQIIIKNN